MVLVSTVSGRSQWHPVAGCTVFGKRQGQAGSFSLRLSGSLACDLATYGARPKALEPTARRG